MFSDSDHISSSGFISITQKVISISIYWLNMTSSTEQKEKKNFSVPLLTRSFISLFTFYVICILYTRGPYFTKCPPQGKKTKCRWKKRNLPCNTECWAFLDFAVLWKLGYALYRIFCRCEVCPADENRAKGTALHIWIQDLHTHCLLAVWRTAVNNSKVNCCRWYAL